MVRITQTVEAAYELEANYGSPPGTNLYHLGLLDTFDPRAVEMNITPVPSIGQSTDAHHASGPIAVNLPLKVACQGTGWKQLLGQAIGSTTIGTALPHSLTSTAGSLAVLARDSAGDHTLVTGVVPNEVTLEADYTTGGYITVDAACTAYYTMDDDDTDDGNFNGFLGDDYSGDAFPSAPSADPLLPSNLIVTCGPNLGNSDVTASTKGLQIQCNNAAEAGSYVEVGEKYIRFYDKNGADTSVGSSGVIDISTGDASTLGNGSSSGAAGGLTKIINDDANWACSPIGSADAELSVNLQKGIYYTEDNRNIYVATEADGTGYGDNTSSADFFKNLKTVSLKIMNNNVSIPARTVGDDASVKWLQNSKVARGKSDITLDITMTAEDETWYDKYVAKQNIPLIRLDFGTDGSIALTNGTITAFSRPLTAGGETIDTMSIKFRGAGDYKNYSAFAISSDITLVPS
tara:strand:- start:1261 stop:2643 length:1383 start_codon:yes stop_codon:yes gene_type:complete